MSGVSRLSPASLSWSWKPLGAGGGCADIAKGCDRCGRRQCQRIPRASIVQRGECAFRTPPDACYGAFTLVFGIKSISHFYGVPIFALFLEHSTRGVCRVHVKDCRRDGGRRGVGRRERATRIPRARGTIARLLPRARAARRRRRPSCRACHVPPNVGAVTLCTRSAFRFSTSRLRKYLSARTGDRCADIDGLYRAMRCHRCGRSPACISCRGESSPVALPSDTYQILD